MIRYERLRPWKYRLLEWVEFALPGDVEWPEVAFAGGLVEIADGHLSIEAGYAWDGPSGPTIDTVSFMRASLIHDALYQLMRNGLISLALRVVADQVLRDVAREDGMNRLRSWWVYRSVRLFGGRAARPPLPA